MKPNLVLCLAFLLVASVAGADEWYSIDGFTLRTDTSIRIDAPFGGESKTVEFLFDDDLTPGVRAFLIGPEGGPDTELGALVQILQEVRRLTFGEEEILNIAVRPGPAVGRSGRLVTVKTTGHVWFAARIELGETPGGVYSHMAIISLDPTDPSALLERLLNSLEISIEDAAG